MGRVSCDILLEPFIREIFYGIKNTAKEYTLFQMGMCTWEIGYVIRRKVMEKYFGCKINKSIKDFGETRKQRELECKNGRKMQAN